MIVDAKVAKLNVEDRRTKGGLLVFSSRTQATWRSDSDV